VKEAALRQLHFLIAVAEHGTLQAAAQALRISPTGLSLGLDELERTLGVQLTVRRRSKGATLTPASQEVLRRAREITSAVADLGLVAAHLRGEMTGPVRVGCFSPLSPRLVPDLVEELQRRHPMVRLQLVEGPADELQSQVRAGKLDLALIFDNQAEPDMSTIRLMPTQTQVQLSARHRLGRRRRIRLAEIVAEPLIVLNLQPTVALTMAMFRDQGLEPNVLLYTANPETVRSLVARRLGYSLIMVSPLRTPVWRVSR
jgi:DNA-binding transcriptional LysR family regulator